MNSLTFMDLFCGIGGFHQALSCIGATCKFACEVDEQAIKTYEDNYDVKVTKDITKVKNNEIPYVDILAGGFPCQPFSKAGSQLGFSDSVKGNLFFEIHRILEHFVKKGTPIKYVILENVRRLETHDNGNTWKIIFNSLKKLGYILERKPLVLSPLHFGIPQSRDRVFIVCRHESVSNSIEYEKIKNIQKQNPKVNESNIFENHVSDKYYLDKTKLNVLKAWEEFVDLIIDVPSFPIWIDAFDGQVNSGGMVWKKNIIEKNIEFYNKNKQVIDDWIIKHEYCLHQSKGYRKFEWQCGNYHKGIKETIIQFRTSGLRCKKRTFMPALVAKNDIPIIFDEFGYRNLTPRECARLQSFPENFIINSNDVQAYKQFGNSVNVVVVKKILEEIFKGEEI